MTISRLSEAYEAREPALYRAKERLQSILREIVKAIDDKTLVRAEVRQPRVKSLASLERKTRKNNWHSTDALTLCSDLIGGRVVCNNTDDVYRFAELLKESLPIYSEAFEIQDFIRQPNKGGYRALHVNFRLNIGETFEPDLVPCEVQIRTRLQDAWAELSHGDIYIQPDLPEDLPARAKDLAEVLAAADKIASDIRLRAVRETIPPEQRPNLGRVSAAALAFVFKDVFGRSPPDYVVTQALNSCDALGVTSLERLPEVLGRGEFREKLSNAYRNIIGMQCGHEDLFLAAIYALVRGDEQAVKHVQRHARRELRELEYFTQREMLASLPDTVQELTEQLKDPDSEADVAAWAEALGATGKCAVCSTTIIRPDTFAEAALHHYELAEPEANEVYQRIVQAICNSGVDTGGESSSSLCSYHDWQATRED